MSAPKTVAARMRIPVNPEFDLEADPHENEYQYVNPVQLNNQLIVLANEQVSLAQVRVAAEREIVALKLDKRKLERKLEDLEEALLRDNPLSPSEAKSLKTIGAAVARRVKEAGNEAVFAELRDQIRDLEDKTDEQLGLAARSRIYSDTAYNVSENIKTHLSFVKYEVNEAKQHGRFGA